MLLITGMSGAGMTTALKALEDIGYDCIDHLPLRLLPRLLGPGDDQHDIHDTTPLAIGIDVRTRDFTVESLFDVVDGLNLQSVGCLQTVFLHCDDDELCRRYSATRHRHPLAVDVPLTECIQRERRLLSPLRHRADVTIDTTALTPGELKRILEGHFVVATESRLLIHVLSFSFRSGLPRDADLVFDVRFLANPYYRSELRLLTGKDQPVAQHIEGDPAFEPFFASLTGLLQPLIPRYAKEGKSYLTIAVGCTGGRHRSVFVSERLAGWLRAQEQSVLVHHRDLDRSAGRPFEADVRTP